MPMRPFLFTLDQVAYLIGVTEKDLVENYVYFFGRTEGRYRAGGGYVKAFNIAPSDKPPVWRVSEEDLLRWLESKGYTVYH